MRRGRPNFFTRYTEDMAIFRNNVQRFWFVVGIVAALTFPFFADRNLMLLGSTALVASIGSIGLNIITGYAGQVSLGHAFFIGVGAYTAAALGGDSDGKLIGLGLDMWIWLPAAGLVAAVAGSIVAPIALRLRGLYLALVTLGLVFLGEHVFRNWVELTGGQGVGREPAAMRLFGYRFDAPGNIAGLTLTRDQQIYLVCFVVMVVMALLAKNLVRSRVGRAFAAVRDRDIAAEIMGIDIVRYKVLAFAVSSFFAGITGALLFTITGFVEPSSFNLLLSVIYIAMVVIGGAASIAGSIMGAFFLTWLPKIIDITLDALPFDAHAITDALTVSQIERMLFGVLIIVFMIFEPLGLYGIWIRIRNYWKTFPFSY